MNRKGFLRHLAAYGCHVLREGAKHTIVVNPANRRQASVPRHRELATFTVRAICRQMEIPTL